MISVNGKNEDRNVMISCKEGARELSGDLRALGAGISSSFKDNPDTLIALVNSFHDGLMKGVSNDVEIEEMKKEMN